MSLDKMDQEILNRLEEVLYKKYKSLNSGYLFIENYDGIIVLNWTPQNDLYINYNRVEQIKNFMYNFLKQNNQEGFFYTGTHAIKI